MGWKELNGKQIESLLQQCEEHAGDLSLLKTVEPYQPESLEDDIEIAPIFVCENQRDSAVLDMLALCKIFQLSVQVFSQSVGIFDRFLSVIKVRPKFLNCISLSCIYLALQLEQSTSSGADLGPPGASDINRFISASESRCTYSDVVRMSGVIAKKLALDLENQYTTLYTVFVALQESINIGCFGAIVDFYATCLCSHDLVVISPKCLLIAICGVFAKPEQFMKIKHELRCVTDCENFAESNDKIKVAYENYLESGKPRKSGKLGLLKKYIFKISQRTGQALMTSKSRIMALGSANNLTPIQEETITSGEVEPTSLAVDIDQEDGKENFTQENHVKEAEESGPPSKKKRKTQKYSKVPLWFVFSNHATARASKPYYQHLVSSWCPWNSTHLEQGLPCCSNKSHDKKQLLSAFLIN